MSGKRAIWEPAMEQTLLELFETARQDPQRRTRRGIRAQAWIDIVSDLNRRYKSSFMIDQVKSKYARLMLDYDLYSDVSGDKSLTEGDWKQILAAKPEYTSKFRQLKEYGYHHFDICRRIAALKPEADTVPLTQPSINVGMRKPQSKRSSSSDSAKPPIKKMCVGVDKRNGKWDLFNEKLLMSLCWKAKNERKASLHEELDTQIWADLTTELKKLCTVKFHESELIVMIYFKS
ncbi:hypothetical protein PsorP6_008933 [Peronosclerospora sorghi]|uniref:Uncharacterized protein n=1 Tax=Peronosclerospora sorghi TaxID=230839 RepID=A0ACC0VZ30_9STRA|nr:hypothetical protein PsorP6_008933 [Peronosclerospora sorghi]